jgi:hypothetical protein
LSFAEKKAEEQDGFYQSRSKCACTRFRKAVIPDLRSACLNAALMKAPLVIQALAPWA